MQLCVIAVVMRNMAPLYSPYFLPTSRF